MENFIFCAVSDQINLVKNDEALVLNTFFENIVKNLGLINIQILIL